MAARDYALITLDARTLPNWPPGQLRPRPRDPRPPADPRDRALAEQIILGVIKNLLHLQHLIAHYAQRPVKKIDPVPQKILAVALYQVRFLDRVPAPAAVHVAVEQAKRFHLPRAAGFINAVLRKALNAPAPEMPDPSKRPADFAELVLSHPKPLFRRFEQVVGTPDALRLCRHNNAEPPTIVRLFDGSAVDDLEAGGITFTPHVQPGLYVVKPVRPRLLAEWARTGMAQVQDPTAAAVVPKLDLRPGQTVLDRCCGLGTKTFQMHAALGTDGKVVAVDPSDARCETLCRLASDRKITNLSVRRTGMLEGLSPEDPKTFDRILIDAPCSNSGVLARRPEARYAQTDAALASLARLQDRILDDTAPMLAKGGRLVYSTCSIWTEENESRVEAFLARRPNCRLVEQHTTLPSLDPDPAQYRDGGYYAVLEAS